MSGAKHGDVIKVAHSLYSHYGIYVKTLFGERVIHYTGEDGPQDLNGIVRETDLSVFLNGEEDYQVCHLDPKVFKTIYSGSETVARAKSKLSNKGYNLLWNNCEHFAIWCKTGESVSSQVRDLTYGIPDNVFSFFEDLFNF